MHFLEMRVEPRPFVAIRAGPASGAALILFHDISRQLRDIEGSVKCCGYAPALGAV